MSNSQSVRSAIIPVAGRGTRMFPLTASVPKEMLATSEGPIIDLIVRELIASGIEQIILITSPGKESIQKHLETINLPETVSGKPVQLIFMNQLPIAGNGGAILTGARVVRDEPFVVVWGDELYISKVPRVKQLIEIYEKLKKPVIALAEVASEDVSKYGIAKIKSGVGKDLFEISEVVEKPTIEAAPSRFASVGGYIVTPELVKILEKLKPLKDGELYLSQAHDHYCKTESLLGKLIEADRFDTGNMAGYVSAFIAIAMRDQALSEKVRKAIFN